MKLVKMSLVAAVAVASLSTVSFAGAEITGKTDFRWKTEMDEDKGKASGFYRDRIDLNVVSKSSDGNGKVHLRARAEKGNVGVNKAYATYKMMGMTVGFGPKIGSPGKFSFSTNSGATLTKKVGAITVKVGAFDNGMKADKQIVAVVGKAGPANFALDFGMGDEATTNNFLATVAHIKAGPAKLGLGYAKGMSKPVSGADDERSILGFSAGMSMAGLNLGGGYTMAGDGGGAIVERTAGTGLPKELGYAYGALSAKSNTFYVHASKKIAGITLGGFYSSADIDGKTSTYIQGKIVKKFNAQSKVTIFYHNKDADGTVATNSLDIRFTSKI